VQESTPNFESPVSPQHPAHLLPAACRLICEESGVCVFVGFLDSACAETLILFRSKFSDSCLALPESKFSLDAVIAEVEASDSLFRQHPAPLRARAAGVSS
jgi:hypothetical protein